MEKVPDNRKTKKYIFRILMIAWMVIIFLFSSRDGDTSQEDSYLVGMAVCHVFVPGFEERSPEEQMELAQRIDHPIRKTAHATEYAILGIFTFFAMGYSIRRKALIAWAVGTAYAATDEFHQLFVPGRSGQFTDVCIDSGGCIIGILLVLCILLLCRKCTRYKTCM